MLTTEQKFAQELLSTFSTDLGEVALIPRTGGVFTVTVFHSPSPSTAAGDGNGNVKESVIWDRKRDGGFPGTCLSPLPFSSVWLVLDGLI